ncbi:MAG TPA: PQQ-dependent sugar dehydrogenase [Steroidobacteraceae bacterium]|nr:PQQ-dependent sugar dehydrogenase [Steroidobacteraceae bacterium]
MSSRVLAVGAAMLGLAAGQALATEIATEKHRIRLVEVASGLEHPWGMAFLPDGAVLVTERGGRLRVVGLDGSVSKPVEGVPAVDAVGQGGLLDVGLDPDFAANRLVYLAYTEPREGGNATAVARGRLADSRLDQLQVIFRQQPALAGRHHFGSRLVFARDGRLFVTLGDRYKEKDRAQTLDSHLGKVVRIERDGRVPADNPFVDRPGALPEIWSYGHRNVQGAALHPATGDLWTNEHGPKGGDELNRTLPGRNYGWPAITYGVDYSGAIISDKTAAPGMEQPAHYWVPSIATSGLAFCTSQRFPHWQGNAFVGGLRSQQLVRLELDGDRVVHEEVLLKGVIEQRVRDVRQGPDGYLYLLTDEKDGRLLRIEPVE